ncbi:hypothetical protein GCM10009826_33440 [Humibacillus xanthopallidus]
MPWAWAVTKPAPVGLTAVTVIATTDVPAGIPSRPATARLRLVPAATAPRGAPSPDLVSSSRWAGSGTRPPGTVEPAVAATIDGDVDADLSTAGEAGEAGAEASAGGAAQTTRRAAAMALTRRT